MTDNLRRLACVAQNGGHYWPVQVYNCLGCGLFYAQVSITNKEPYVMEERARTTVTPDGEVIVDDEIPQPYALPEWLHYDR